jgi:hypothetical protein
MEPVENLVYGINFFRRNTGGDDLHPLFQGLIDPFCDLPA